MPVYEVRDLCGYRYLVEARSAREARAIICRRRGIRPNDPLLGISILTARRIKESEEEKAR